MVGLSTKRGSKVANQEHVELLKRGVDEWNQWRENNPNLRPDLREIELKRVDLRGVNLRKVDLSGAVLRGANLSKVDLSKAVYNGPQKLDRYLSSEPLKK
jgi:uncharacterized protein YjbI with pentapeptide repeats